MDGDLVKELRSVRLGVGHYAPLKFATDLPDRAADRLEALNREVSEYREALACCRYKAELQAYVDDQAGLMRDIYMIVDRALNTQTKADDSEEG